MRIVTRVRIIGDKFFFSMGPMELFKQIDRHSSIKKAAEQMGMSYTKALRIIRVAEDELGFALVISEKGGNSRGQTRLTAKGAQVLKTFEEIQCDVSDFAQKLFEERFTF